MVSDKPSRFTSDRRSPSRSSWADGADWGAGSGEGVEVVGGELVGRDPGQSSVPVSTLTQDLVAWYRFEDADARDYTATLDVTFADSTPYDGSVGAVTIQNGGGTTDFDVGQDSGSAVFDGTSDAEIGLPFDGLSFNTYSISFWVLVDHLHFGYNQGYWFDSNHDDRYYVYLSSNDCVSSNYGQVTGITKSDLGSGVWNHITIAADGSAEKWYLNAVQKDTTTGGGDFAPSINFVLGGFNFEHLDGRIDDFRLYNRALSDSDIAEIYNATKP